MRFERAAVFALMLVGCGGDPEGDVGPEPSSAGNSEVTGGTPPDMEMPVMDSTSSTPSSGSTSGSVSTTGTGGASASSSSSVTSGATGSATASSATTTSGPSSSSETSTSNGSTGGAGGSTTTGQGAGGTTAGQGGTGQGGTGQGGTGGTVEGQCEVMPLSAEFRQNYDNLDPFYQKYADANGLPVISSLSPADEALTRACELVLDMTSARPDVHAALIENHIRFAIIAEDELTNDIPEYAYLDDSINQRARGLGGTPAASCAEESILCHTELDPWHGEGICPHEFAHTIATAGLFVVDPTFEERLQAAYQNAQSTGLFENTYAMENFQEYWAEGVQDWYFTNLEADPPNGIHNFVDRREELLEYDPTLYDLIAEFLPDVPKFVDCYSDE